MNKNLKIISGISILALASLYFLWTKPSKPQDVQKEYLDNSNALNYKDGTYQVVTNYLSPGGKDSLGVKITLAQNNIVAVEVKNMAGDQTSNNYQNKFIGGIQSVSVGQSIDNLKLGVVSGASLATGAFNEALEKIRLQATTN